MNKALVIFSFQTNNSTGLLTYVSNDAQGELLETSTLSPSSLSESRQPETNKKTKNKLMPTFSSFETHDQSSIAKPLAGNNITI